MNNEETKQEFPEGHLQNALPKMPRYQRNKIIRAAQIDVFATDVSSGNTCYWLNFSDNKIPPVKVDTKWINANKPRVNGYYVVGSDGASWYVPKDTFEEAYTQIQEGKPEPVYKRILRILAVTNDAELCILHTKDCFTDKSERACFGLDWAKNKNPAIGDYLIVTDKGERILIKESQIGAEISRLAKKVVPGMVAFLPGYATSTHTGNRTSTEVEPEASKRKPEEELETVTAEVQRLTILNHELDEKLRVCESKSPPFGIIRYEEKLADLEAKNTVLLKRVTELEAANRDSALGLASEAWRKRQAEVAAQNLPLEFASIIHGAGPDNIADQLEYIACRIRETGWNTGSAGGRGMSAVWELFRKPNPEPNHDQETIRRLEKEIEGLKNQLKEAVENNPPQIAPKKGGELDIAVMGEVLTAIVTAPNDVLPRQDTVTWAGDILRNLQVPPQEHYSTTHSTLRTSLIAISGGKMTRGEIVEEAARALEAIYGKDADTKKPAPTPTPPDPLSELRTAHDWWKVVGEICTALNFEMRKYDRRDVNCWLETDQGKAFLNYMKDPIGDSPLLRNQHSITIGFLLAHHRYEVEEKWPFDKSHLQAIARGLGMKLD